MRPVICRFQKFDLNSHELEMALQPSPYFWGYLQNKIADYAMAVVEISYETSGNQEAAIIEHERRKAQVEVLEELMRELTPPPEQTPEPPTPTDQGY